MKGLVSVKLALPKASHVISDGPVRKPINKQTALLIRPALEIFKPLPSDPDLEDRKVVLAFLKERESMINTVQLLKQLANGYQKKYQELHKEMHRLKSQIFELQAGSHSIENEPKEDTPLPAIDLSRFSDDELAAIVKDLEAHRASHALNKDFSLKLEFVFRETQGCCEKELYRRFSLARHAKSGSTPASPPPAQNSPPSD